MTFRMTDGTAISDENVVHMIPFWERVGNNLVGRDNKSVINAGKMVLNDVERMKAYAIEHGLKLSPLANKRWDVVLYQDGARLGVMFGGYWTKEDAENSRQTWLDDYNRRYPGRAPASEETSYLRIESSEAV